MAELKKYQMYVDNEWIDAENNERFESLNPSAGEPWATIPAASAKLRDYLSSGPVQHPPFIEVERNLAQLKPADHPRPLVPASGLKFGPGVSPLGILGDQRCPSGLMITSSQFIPSFVRQTSLK